MKTNYLSLSRDMSFLKKQILLFFWFSLIVTSSLFSAAADPGPEISAEQYEKEIMELKIREVKDEVVAAQNVVTIDLGPLRAAYKIGDLEQGQRYAKLAKRIKRSRNLSREEKAYLRTLAEYYGAFIYTRAEKSPGYVDPTAIQFGLSGSGLKDDFFFGRVFDKDTFCPQAKRIRSAWKKEFRKLKRKKEAQVRDYWLTGEIDNSYAPCQNIFLIQSTSKAARKSFDEALEINSGHPLANIGRAVFYYRQAKGKTKAEDLNTAVRLLKTAIIGGNDYEKYLAHLWLSQVYLKLDTANTSEASAEVERAKRIYSKGPFIDFVSKLLARGKHI